MPIQQLIEDDLSKRSAKHANKLGSSWVSAPLATNVDLWNPIVTSKTKMTVTWSRYLY